MDTIIAERIKEDSDDPFTCRVKEDPKLVCLDIAAPSTLSGEIQSQNFGGVTVFDATSDSGTPLFGASQRCNGKVVGDHSITPLDMAVLLYYIFGVRPYDKLPRFPSQVATINGGTDIGTRCKIGRNTTVQANYYAEDACGTAMSGGTGRRLSDAASLGARTEKWATSNSGTWYRIHMPEVLIAVELRLSGVRSTSGVPLSSEAAPTLGGSDEPHDPTAYEVRFARHAESTGGDVRGCSTIQSIVNPTTALLRNTLAVGQFPETACGFDLFLWVPEATDGCDVAVMSGSVAIDGRGGAYQRPEDETCSAPSALFPPSPSVPSALFPPSPSVPSALLPPSPSVPSAFLPSAPSAPLPPSPSAQPPKDGPNGFAIIVICVIILLVLLCIVRSRGKSTN